MAFVATVIQIVGGTTAQLLAGGRTVGAADSPMDVRVLNLTGTGPVRLGGPETNASTGYPWAATSGEFKVNSSIGDDLYAAAVASCQVHVLKSRS